jgi:ABC-type sulfate transport system permease subunit
VREALPPLAGASAEPAWLRRLLIGAALAFLALFLFVPLASVFAQALGWTSTGPPWSTRTRWPRCG